MKEFFLLLMIVNTPVGEKEVYVGKVPDCSFGDAVYQEYRKTEKDANGYLCITHDVWKHRQPYVQKLTPTQERKIKDIRESLPKAVGKPIVPLKKREAIKNKNIGCMTKIEGAIIYEQD
jgi:hypothetical protein